MIRLSLDWRSENYYKTDRYDVLFPEMHVRRGFDHREFRAESACRARTIQRAATGPHRRNTRRRQLRASPVTPAGTTSSPRSFWWNRVPRGGSGWYLRARSGFAGEPNEVGKSHTGWGTSGAGPSPMGMRGSVVPSVTRLVTKGHPSDSWNEGTPCKSTPLPAWPSSWSWPR